MKLKNSQIQNLHAALAGLEPLEKCPKCGEPLLHSAVPFEFSGQTRWDIVLNLKALEDVLAKLEGKRVKLVEAGLKPGEKELTGEAREEFIKNYLEILDAETDVTLQTITRAALFNPRLPVGTENQIPLRTLMLLRESGLVV